MRLKITESAKVAPGRYCVPGDIVDDVDDDAGMALIRANVAVRLDIDEVPTPPPAPEPEKKKSKKKAAP